MKNIKKLVRAATKMTTKISDKKLLAFIRCSKKKLYITKERALRDMAAVIKANKKKKFIKKLHVYQCTVCMCYHVGGKK